MSLRSEVVRIFNELLAGAKKISELPAASSVDAADLVEISQGGVSKKATASQFGGGGGGGTWGSITGTLSDQTDLQAALDQNSDDIANHIADTTGAHAASAISNTPTGNISATDVQAAINELDSEKQPIDSDLTDIAALTPSNDDFIQRKAGVWTNRTVVQVQSDLLPDASESVKGIIEIATQAETDTGTDDVRAITPLKGATKYANKLETINTQTADYTLVLTDKDIKTVVMNIAATSNTVTVPPNSSVAFPVGSIITIAQLGTGLTSVAAGAGVTIRSSTGALAGQGQYSPMVIEKIATDEWFLWNGPPALAGAALTRTNDTNVTATLSGSPSTALLAAVDIALAWTGTLAVTRGGTGLSASANGDVVIGTGTNTMGVVNALATTRTAYWHLKAGTATASTAPLKFTSGTNLTAVENGAVEYDGTNYFVSSGGVRYTLAKVLANSAVIDFGSVSAQSEVSNTITVTGASDGDEVILGYTNAAANAGLIFSARVSATNTVTVTAYNITASPIDPASATFKVSVIKR